MSSSQGLIFSKASYNNGYSNSSSLDHLQYQSFEVFNADMATSPAMEDYYSGGGGGGGGGGCVNTPPMLFSPYESGDVSTGYLQDALLEFSSRSKRRRLLVYPDEPSSSDYHLPGLDKSYCYNSNCINWGDFTGDLNWMMMMMNQVQDQDQDNWVARVSDEHMSNSVSDNEANIMSISYHMKESLDTNSAMETPNSSCSASSNPSIHSVSDKSIPCRSLVPTTSPGEDVKKVKKVTVAKRIVYPFELVKPGGVEGDMTINDINERNLMPPTRPVRHPVGDFACRPCVSPQGPGISGKAVVALTKIQTQGRGTITIIRTSG